MMHRKIVYVVDDDGEVVRDLVRVVPTLGFEAVAYESAAAFLGEVGNDNDVPACVLLDAFIEPEGGIGVLEELVGGGIDIPVICMSDVADVGNCASAMKRGAVDYLLKPLSVDALGKAIAHAHAIGAERHRAKSAAQRATSLLFRLTPRERAVLDLVLAGRRNKEIADALASQEATVKVHRSRLMHKLEVRSIPELVELVATSQGKAFRVPDLAALRYPLHREPRNASGRRILPAPCELDDQVDGGGAWARATGTWNAYSWPRQ
ncbi:MAG: response regulator transcription factor [Burkholderiales bacterium]|nr:response regulator transcription factor [Burkholderiales bacterium]